MSEAADIGDLEAIAREHGGVPVFIPSEFPDGEVAFEGGILRIIESQEGAIPLSFHVSSVDGETSLSFLLRRVDLEKALDESVKAEADDLEEL